MNDLQPTTDNELRGRVLLLFYQYRRKRWHDSDGADVVPSLDARDFVDICQQLESHGLINIVNKKPNCGSIVGVGAKITAFGIDAVESKGVKSPITIVFNFSSPQNVQIGNQNTQVS